MTDLNNIRVRFAPSPTGYLHIGGLRTALFNYLFAKHNNGKFILRIEDTDQQRKIEGAVENLIMTLKSVGLNYDEGPEIGGDYGPYFQSQRLDIYKNHIEQLLTQGDAYYSFETSEELDEMRKQQIEQGTNQAMYDRSARNLSKEEVEEKIKQGIPYVIRLKVPLDSEIKFNDLIRGEVTIDTNLVDDQVLMKSDGYPTYHFANVIDDHLMEISHVIRGEEWLTSVPKHILLYKAFGWEIPKMAHVPLILNPDRSKLSKRQGDVATEDFQRKGYLPEALINFIALLGWNPGEGENREIFSLDELVKMFTIERIQGSGAVFNIEKLNWMNNQYMQKMMMSESGLKKLDSNVRNFLPNEYLRLMSTIGATYSTTPSTATAPESAFQIEEQYPLHIALNKEQRKIINTKEARKAISLLIDKLQLIDENESIFTVIGKLKAIIKEIQKETGLKGKSLYHPLRLILSGKEQGLDLAIYINGRMKLFGKQKILDEIRKNLED
jgi:glutamyl-tRNA synthetase